TGRSVVGGHGSAHLEADFAIRVHQAGRHLCAAHVHTDEVSVARDLRHRFASKLLSKGLTQAMLTYSERGWARRWLYRMDLFAAVSLLRGTTKPGAYESTLSGRLRGREPYYISRCRGIPLMASQITRCRPRRLGLCDAKSRPN